MHDFPPTVAAFPSARTATDAAGRPRGGTGDSERSGRRASSDGQPDTRSPTRFLIWMLRQQWDVVAMGGGLAVLWYLPGTVGPFLIGRAIDRGISAGSPSALVAWSAVLLGAIVVAGIFGVLGHTMVVRGWLIAMFRTGMLVIRKSTQLGHVLPQRTPTGEVLSVASSDSDQFGALTEIISRTVGSTVAFFVIAGIVLSTSTPLGLIVLLGAPVLVFASVPLLRPMQRSQALERDRTSTLTSQATDIVAGLRILRGIGGEITFGRNYAEQSQRVRQAGVRAGGWQSLADAASVLFSGLFLVGLTWVGAREVLAGRLRVGELISFFGYATFLLVPIRNLFECAQKWVRSLVSATKAVAILNQQPPWRERADPLRLPHGAALVDQHSGLVASPGRLTVVVSGRPDDSASLADRLGRYLRERRKPVSLEVDAKLKGRAARLARRERDQALAEAVEQDQRDAEQTWGVRLGDVDLGDATLAEVRRMIMVSDTGSRVFAGTLQEAIDPHGQLTRQQAEQAIYVAGAEDVYDAVPGGWSGLLEEGGRGLSGGQRQRLVLARAIAADPEILVLVEPTSAVDAHTEARIAERLAEHRRGRTTVVASTSPLILHHADEVALLIDGQVAATGTHQQLLAGEPRYRRVVARSLDDATDDATRDATGDATDDASDHARDGADV